MGNCLVLLNNFLWVNEVLKFVPLRFLTKLGRYFCIELVSVFPLVILPNSKALVFYSSDFSFEYLIITERFVIVLLINVWIVDDRSKYKEVGEGWFHHQEANQDPLSFSSTSHEGGQEKGSPFWIWYVSA